MRPPRSIASSRAWRDLSVTPGQPSKMRMLILGQHARSASMLTSVILIQCDTWTSWKLNKDPDFVLSLHFSQYFNACPGLAMLSLPARRSGDWDLGTKCDNYSGFLLKVKSEEIWARDWDRYQGRQGKDSLVKEKDCWLGQLRTSTEIITSQDDEARPLCKNGPQKQSSQHTFKYTSGDQNLLNPNRMCTCLLDVIHVIWSSQAWSYM